MDKELTLELNNENADASAEQADESVVFEGNNVALDGNKADVAQAEQSGDASAFIDSEEEHRQAVLDATRNAKKRKKIIKAIFIISMMAYPVLHFLIMWGYVNARSLVFTFQQYQYGTGWVFVGFKNYGRVFSEFFTDSDVQTMLLNSLLYIPITCLITIPLSIIFSYIIFKKLLGAGVFRTIFFLPSIVPLVILTMVFQFAFKPTPFGIIAEMMKWFGGTGVIEGVFAQGTTFSVYFFCVWAGVGYYIILLGGALARIPKGVMEYSQLEGVGMFRELVQICIPLSWPTIVTVLVLGMTSMFTVFLQPFFLTGYIAETKTLALRIFVEASAEAQYGYLATLGLVCSLIGAPLIMLARWGLSKCFAEVEF